jgi:hypothetical protein
MTYRWLLGLFIFLISSIAVAHGVDDSTKAYLLQVEGIAIAPFMYIGAKHMVTGYDHLLFLVGVIFFLFRSKDILIYVSLFTLGHSLTLLTGVMANISVNAYLIDAIIGLSIVYKGLDNLGAFKSVIGIQPNPKLAVLIFGLFHGFGLATKIQEFGLKQDGLFANLLSFNLGVEIGQFFALSFILLGIAYWRRFSSFLRFANVTNTLLISAGFVLFGFQITGYFMYP